MMGDIFLYDYERVPKQLENIFENWGMIDNALREHYHEEFEYLLTCREAYIDRFSMNDIIEKTDHELVWLKKKIMHLFGINIEKEFKGERNGE
jgi:hypothetical protein